MNSEWQNMLAGELYDPADPLLVERRAQARALTFAFNQCPPSERTEKVRLLKSLFGSSGEQIHIEPSFQCDYGCNIHVGENFYANYHCVILDVAEVRMGNNCMLGPQVGIYTATHPLDPDERNRGASWEERSPWGTTAGLVGMRSSTRVSRWVTTWWWHQARW